MNKEERIRFLKHAIKVRDKRIRVRYSKGSYTKESGLPEGTITIYAKDYGSQLPSELKPINETDLQTDYFETDRARIVPKSKYYKQVNKILKKINS
jgi:hypothetical protein